MSDPSPPARLPTPPSPSPSMARAPQAADGHGGLRLLALGAVAFGVLLLAAAAFVLSYAGIHAVALSAGVSPRLARIYPLIFDAMLIVTCAAVLSLRGGGLPSRTYAWLSMLVLLAAAAAADALNATGTKLPRRPAAATAAVIPWALVLIGFGLLLCMLRKGRLRRAAAQPSSHVGVRDVTVSPPAPSTSNGDGTARLVRDQPGATADLPRAASGAGHAPDLAIDAEPGQDDPATDEAGPAEQPEFARAPHQAREEQAAGHGGRYRDRSASAFSPAPTLPQAIGPETDAAAPGKATEPRPGRGSDDNHDPEPVTVSSDVEPSSETEPSPEAELGPGAEAGVEAEVGWEQEVLAESDPDPEARPGVASAAETQAGPEGTEAEVWPEAEPLPARPHFDRKRSSPVPPEA